MVVVVGLYCVGQVECLLGLLRVVLLICSCEPRLYSCGTQLPIGDSIFVFLIAFEMPPRRTNCVEYLE